MASTASYRIGTKEIRNSICFAQIINNSSEKEKVIIIEKDKQFYPVDEILSYINDINFLTEGIQNTTIKEDETIEILLKKELSSLTLKFICISIRYLWEGKYLVKGTDEFYLIYEHFFRLKQFFPELDKGLLFALASNLFHSNSKFFNSNHTIGLGTVGCEFFTAEEIKEKIKPNGLINSTLAGTTKLPILNLNITTKKEYVDAMEVINKFYNKQIFKLNAQETDKEQVIFPKYLVMQHGYPTAFVVRKKDFTDYDSKDELEFIPIKIGSIS